jgi:hypothetical protein
MAEILLSDSAKTKLKKINISSSSTPKLSGVINTADFNNIIEVKLTSLGITEFKGNNNLEVLELDDNELLTFPVLSGLTNLVDLKISNENRLTSLPTLSTLDKLKELKLTNCDNLTSTLPDFKFFPFLTFADFRNSGNDGKFIGDIPALSSNSALQQFYVNGNNQLSGFIPSLDFNSDLHNFNISRVGLSGSVHDFKNTPDLQTYHVFQNSLTGSLPELSAAPNLITADFNENFLTGSIPFLNNLTKIKTLNINNNALSGRIPEITNLVSLEAFRIQNNKRLGRTGIIGDIPDLSGSTNLKTFDAASNQLTGWAGTVWPSSRENQNIQIQNNNLTTAALNTLLSALCATGAVNGTIQMGGSNDSPTGGSSNPQRLILVDRGWTVGV